MSCERLLMERKFAFKSNDEKAFKKLSGFQFESPEHGIVYEPLANCFDVQQSEAPVEITLKKRGDAHVLTFKDNGPGLIISNLLSLHFIGRSSKRDDLEHNIGRFGFGLVGSFHPELELINVQIKARVCGENTIITYNFNNNKGIPGWFMSEYENDIEGMEISYFLKPHVVPRIRRELKDFLRQTVIPVKYNNRIYKLKPETLAKETDTLSVIKDKDGLEVYYFLHDGYGDYVDNNTDDMIMYLRGMPVEKDDMTKIFYGYSPGAKLPQNLCGEPFDYNGSCIVLATKGEPTVGRDKLVRNADFNKNRKAVMTARADAILNKLKTCSGRKSLTRMAIANIYTLKNKLKSYLSDNEVLPIEDEYLVPLLEHLADMQLFPAFNRGEALTLREIYLASPPGNVFLYANSIEGSTVFQGYHKCPFVLVDLSYENDFIFGYHKLSRISSIVSNVCNGEFIDLEELVLNTDKQNELIRKGVLEKESYSARDVEIDSNARVFFENLQDLLNKSWFKRALSDYYPPRKIVLAAVTMEHKDKSHRINGEFIACVLNNRNTDALKIGINLQSNTIRTLINDSVSGHIAFLPILCHELSHRKINISYGNEDLVSHNTNFYFDRIRLEDKVLQKCVSYLLGKDDVADSTDDMSNDFDVVIL